MVPWSELPLRGEHNALNLCAALTALEAVGVSAPQLPGALQGLRTLPHRLEIVGERDGTLWVDDSISTTPESTLAALQSFADREIVLIAGGKDRGQDHAALARELASRGAAVVGLPVTGARLVRGAARAAWQATARGRRRTCGGGRARARSRRPGTTVLLSPAAASYNTYLNFEQRGADFRARIEEGSTWARCRHRAWRVERSPTSSRCTRSCTVITSGSPDAGGHRSTRASESWTRRRARYAQWLPPAGRLHPLARRDGHPLGYALASTTAGYQTWASGERSPSARARRGAGSPQGTIGTALLDAVERALAAGDT